jgi:hypothetical protein
MNEPLYKCFHCRDIGVVVRQRHDLNGTVLGSFGSPCLNCEAGDAERADWNTNGLRRAAEQNEIVIRRHDALIESDEPGGAAAEQWRTAARDRQSRREAKLGPTPLGSRMDIGAARRPSAARTSTQPEDPA